MKKLMKRGLILVGGAAGILLFSALLYYRHVLLQFAEEQAHIAGFVELDIPKGSSTKAIANMLKRKALISDARYFEHYARFVAWKAHNFQAGYYLIEGTSTPEQIAGQLQEGHEREYRFVIPEGSSEREIAAIIANAGIASRAEISRAMHDPELIKACGNDSGVGGVEGFLFPDTYQFPRGAPPKKILQRLCDRFKDKLDFDIQQRMKFRGIDLHQLLTIASIIEKEASVPEERTLVASVLYNRLKINMPLQMDPTVAYGLKKDAKFLTRLDLMTMNPYNTYRNRGLPPGPIASPSVESIRAALWPRESKYLYYVSRNDGSHQFCENFNCHSRAVHKWQIGPKGR